MCLAVPAKVKKIEKDNAFVDFGGVSKKISLGILSNVKAGDYVLVHAGFAIGKVSETEAEDTFRAMGTPTCGKGEPNQVIHVGHASPACLFKNVMVFGGV